MLNLLRQDLKTQMHQLQLQTQLKTRQAKELEDRELKTV